jgi:hypothetical protein
MRRDYNVEKGIMQIMAAVVTTAIMVRCTDVYKTWHKLPNKGTFRGALPPGGKARPGRDADHSPPSSAEVKEEQELHLLSPPPPPNVSMARVAGPLCNSTNFKRFLCSRDHNLLHMQTARYVTERAT